MYMKKIWKKFFRQKHQLLLLLLLMVIHRKKFLQYGLGEILLPIIRRVIF
jgi:hypothetical protein